MAEASRLRGQIVLGALGLAGAATLVYMNTGSGPFLFDDVPTLLGNPTIRHLWPPWAALSPPHGDGLTTEGRPLLNLSFAINYALSGYGVHGYHVFNLLIHLLAALCLFGLVRRTLEQTKAAPALGTAFFVALLWAVHPLQTESVTYVVQRAESLMGLFFILTLYGLARGAAAPGSRRWLAISVFSCLCGMASKEVMASAPLVALLYDRAFFAGSFARAWRERKGYYCALGSTWVLLALLAIGTGNRGGTAGPLGNVTRFSYLLAQARGIVHYLRLALWPHPLVFDYGIVRPGNAATLIPCVLLVTALVAVSVVGLVRNRAWGWLGATFFMILAPSSSIVPVYRQTLAEHRMYLPLAVPIVFLAILAWRRLGKASVLVGAAAAIGLACTTSARNKDYSSELALYSDSAEKMPQNVFALNNWATSLSKNGQFEKAKVILEKAVQTDSSSPDSHYNLGTALVALNQPAEALAQFREAIRLDPENEKAHYNAANCLMGLGRDAEAISEYGESIRITPTQSKAHYNLGRALLASGRIQESISEFDLALGLDPEMADAAYNRGLALAADRKFLEAAGAYTQALRIRPAYFDAENNLGAVLIRLGRTDAAIDHCRLAVKLEPRNTDGVYNLGIALGAAGRIPEAIEAYKMAVAIKPDFAEAHLNLANALLQSGMRNEAAEHYETALRIEPDLKQAQIGLRMARSGASP